MFNVPRVALRPRHHEAPLHLFLAHLRQVFAQESHQRIRLVLVDLPVELTPSSRPLVCLTCPGVALRPRHHEAPLSLHRANHCSQESHTEMRAMIRQMSVRHHSHHAKSVWSSSHDEHSVSPLSGRTHSGPRHPSHLYGSASSSPECSSPEELTVAVDLGVGAPGTANV